MHILMRSGVVPRVGLTVGSPPGSAAVLRPTRSPTTGTTLGAAVGTRAARVMVGASTGDQGSGVRLGCSRSPARHSAVAGVASLGKGVRISRGCPRLRPTPDGKHRVLHRTYAHSYPQARERLHTALSAGQAGEVAAAWAGRRQSAPRPSRTARTLSA